MARIKRKSHEDFSDEKIEKVISLLENGETKKTCCEVLGMAYNTSRLNKLIENYKSEKELLANNKKRLRGTAVSIQDRTYTIQAYLNGESLSEIADSIYRSVLVVKSILTRYNVPLRGAGSGYFDPVFLTSDPVDDYEAGDLVYSARYITPAKIISKYKGAYKIYLYGKNEKYAYQPYYELGDLRKLQKELNVELTITPDTNATVNNTIHEYNKKRNKK